MFFQYKIYRVLRFYRNQINRFISKKFKECRFLRQPNFLFVLASTGFSFATCGISDEEINSGENKTFNYTEYPSNSLLKENKWEIIYENKNVKVYRRYLRGRNGIYEYKCVGSFTDITPLNFVQTQCDVTYRKKWDENIVTLELLEEDSNTDSQVIDWVARFPYPMYARQYIYVRRKIVDEKNGKIVVVSKALDPKNYRDSGKYIRVTEYASKLIVSAHTNLYKKGLNYTLIYYDNPRSSIPTMAYNWIVNRSGPYFMQKIYEAAKKRELVIDEN